MYKVIQIDRKTLDVEVYFSQEDYGSTDAHIIHSFRLTPENISLRDLEVMIESELEGANRTDTLDVFQNLVMFLKEELYGEEDKIIRILWKTFL